MTDALLTTVATYRRTVGASLERVWENVRDWEHLPWLHSSSFHTVELEASGDWGWRARVGFPGAGGTRTRTSIIELLIDAERSRYVTRTIEGFGEGSEVWTRVERVREDATRIEVEFRIPGVSGDAAKVVGEGYTRLYTRLWDEDERMMQRRTRELRRLRERGPRSSEAPLDLGELDALRRSLPIVVERWRRSFKIVEVEGELLVHPTVCPHALGPLGDSDPKDGKVVCPWHGYAFDLRSGRSCDGRGLQLGRTPRVEIDAVTRRARLV